MAPVSDRIYFPPLEDCLFGDRVLLSWKHVATALSDFTGQRQTSPALIDFFDDEYVHALLKDPASVFAPPSEATQKDYATKTAPINVTSGSGSRVDIEAIKRDAEWLSRSAKLNLAAALRVVIVEIQARPSQHLNGPLSSQDATNLQDAAGLHNGQGSSFLSELGAAAAADADEIWSEFEKPETKKRRLFDTYLLERRYFIMAAEYAHSIKLYGRLPIFAPVDQNLAQLYRLTPASSGKEEIETLLPPYLQFIGASMDKLESGLHGLTDESTILSEEGEMAFFKTVVIEIVHAMGIVLQLADNLGNAFPPPSSVSSWFSTMGKYSFLAGLQPFDDATAELIAPAKTLAAVVSVALLKPLRCMQYFQEREEDPASADSSYDSYLLSSDVLEQVHTTVMAIAESNVEPAAPVCLAWAVILAGMNRSYHSRSEKRDNLLLQTSRERFEASGLPRSASGRRNSAGSIFSIESSRFDTFLEATFVSKDLQTAEKLFRVVTDNGYVYDVISGMASNIGSSAQGSMPPLLSSRIRAWLLEAVQTADPLIGYQEASVGTLITLLSADREYWDMHGAHTLPPDQDLVATMIQSEWLQERFLQTALDRYPEEFLPFITLCRVLCSTLSLEGEDSDQILTLLRQTPTLTFNLPDSAETEELSPAETDLLNYYRISDDISIVSQTSNWRRKQADEDDFRIPAGTIGRFLTQDGQFSQIDFAHSTLALLGRRLQINISDERDPCLFPPLNADMTGEVVLLFATLIRVDSLKTGKATSNGVVVLHEADILHEASKHMTGGKDIVSVICETMDSYLQDDLAMSDENAVNVLNSCVQFLHSVLPHHPSRVWSYLARSDLLNTESRAGKLAKITGNLDLVSSRFEFLRSSICLFSDLVDTAMTSAVQRVAGTRPTGRQRPDSNPWLGISDKVLSRVSYAIAQISVDVFENTTTWKFESDVKRTVLLDNVIDILIKFISYSYGMGDSQKSNLNGALRPAASYVLECFLQPSTGTLRYQPILNSLVNARTLEDLTLYSTRDKLVCKQVRKAMDLCTILLRTANSLERPSGILESYLFKICTMLARVSAASTHFRKSALQLLDSLVFNAGQSLNEPPSLLGYLGPQISRSFLQLLSSIGKPFGLKDEVRTTWRFFSSILRNRQQWMSNCLLTGQTPREAMKKDSKNDIAPDSVFAIALEKLSKLSEVDSAQALVILDFVASAQNYWPWTVFTLQKDTKYLEGLQAYVRNLKPSHQTAKSSVTTASVQARVAAYVAETFAMQLYHSRHLGNADTLAKGLLSDLDYYLRDGVEVAGYNKSLHSNFAKNFSTKYAGCSLDDFRKTLLEPRELGPDYYYDLDRANTMLSFDPGWLGRKQNGFKTEMELANTNLSLVDAQIALFHAWEFLLLELSICLPTNAMISKQMLQVSQQCLNANQGVPGPESIFLKVVDARASLALVLTQRLAGSTLPIKDINQLLFTVVGTINGVEDAFSPDTIPYSRKLLKTLFVVLRAYQSHASKSGTESNDVLGASNVQITQTVLNIIDRVVGRGFRELVNLIHDEQSNVCPEDLALLTAVLQACLSMPGIDQSQTQILNIMASHSCFYAATSLFSWADKLADHGDPIYGELSILYLLELSTLPSLAEQMACDGVLSILLTANLTKFMLKANLSPYSDSPVAQRCYGIWVKGLLPLMLNLLTSLGATVAPEIAYVLNQFSHLLSLSVDRFEVPGVNRTRSRSSTHYLTLLGTSEVHSLALLTRILAALRMNNGRDIPEIEWDTTTLLENVEFWLSSSKLLKERLMPVGQREMDWRSAKKATGVGDNVLEQKVISQLEAVRDVLSEDIEAL